MQQDLTASISDIRTALIRGDYQSEAAISTGVVIRLIENLGWPPYDTRVVFPQFPIENRKVDFALCHPRDKPVVLLEVKNAGRADEKGERQLFEYCFHRGVPIAVLTDGRTWKFFYPAGEGNYADRLFHEMDLVSGDAAEIAGGLIRYLAYSAVASGDARSRARDDSKAIQLQRQAAAKFPSVWDKLLLGPDPTLVELFEKETEAVSGVRPEKAHVIAFIKKQRPEGSTLPPITKIRPWPVQSVRPDPDDVTNDPSGYYKIDGKLVVCKTAKEVLIGVFEEFSRRYSTFCESWAKRMPGGTKRRYLARSKEDLYPGQPERQSKEVHQLPDGWLLATHRSNRDKRKWIKVACEVVGLELGRDFDFRFPQRRRNN